MNNEMMEIMMMKTAVTPFVRKSKDGTEEMDLMDQFERLYEEMDLEKELRDEMMAISMMQKGEKLIEVEL